MISLKAKSDCCGCKACEQVCPTKCITMQNDVEGFWYPAVDKEKCISCNKCEKVCPVKNSLVRNDEIKGAYAARSLDEELLGKSSSGALFTELAKLVINEGGCVFGASFDREFRVVHTCIEKLQDISLLQGSKYVQSDINNSFTKAEVALKQGRRVLFSGTACQIAGLKRYLNREYANLLTVDILCHGVPSPLAWEKYLEEKKENDIVPISSVSFRVKAPEGFYFKIGYKDGTSFLEPVKNNLYMKFFVRNFSLRPSCHACMFKKLNRDSDITLGDCWNAGESIPEMNGKGSVSLVVVHNENGEKALNDIKNNISIYKGDINLLLPENEDSRKSVRPNRKRRAFFHRLAQTEKFSSLSALEKPSCFRKIFWLIKNELP